MLLKHYKQEELVLDIDATVIEAEKSTAKSTYKGPPGYTPMVGHINGGFLIHSEFRTRNIEEHYHVIATNDLEHSAQEMLEFYRQRGEASENRIKELKLGFNMSYLPTSDFMANAFYFAIGTLAYNIFVLFKQTFEESWKRHTVQTIRYKFYNIARKVIHHARKTILKVNSEFVNLINQIRQKSYQISLQ